MFSISLCFLFYFLPPTIFTQENPSRLRILLLFLYIFYLISFPCQKGRRFLSMFSIWFPYPVKRGEGCGFFNISAAKEGDLEDSSPMFFIWFPYPAKRGEGCGFFFNISAAREGDLDLDDSSPALSSPISYPTRDENSPWGAAVGNSP